MNAHLESQMLFVVGNREPVFDERDARADEHLLELGNRTEKLFEIGFRAEAERSAGNTTANARVRSAQVMQRRARRAD